MKLHELCDKMNMGIIKVFERDEPNGFAYRKFIYQANSPLKQDYYNAEVEHFHLKDSTIYATVKRGNNNG